ncbi:hypothetical protein [Haloplanus salinus]|uniref:hypothetical protein n=1 Tax=Haloplanus salinus TaxID=1126245 RepID=UPI0015F02542|nr:hypothetical protein [Haloplanus salinus]
MYRPSRAVAQHPDERRRGWMGGTGAERGAADVTNAGERRRAGGPATAEDERLS